MKLSSAYVTSFQPVMVSREGYPCETHTLITEDCYVLEMHRIPFGKSSIPDLNQSRPVVYLQHGLLGSSADWVMGTPKKFLGDKKCQKLFFIVQYFSFFFLFKAISLLMLDLMFGWAISEEMFTVETIVTWTPILKSFGSLGIGVN